MANSLVRRRFRTIQAAAGVPSFFCLLRQQEDPVSEQTDQRIVTEPSRIAWRSWMQRYDVQQAVYVEARERRFEVMFSLLEDLLPGKMTVLDLMAGPGAVSERLLRRLPLARSVAVDVDPVLMRLGQHVLGDCGGRLRWVRADVKDPTWVDALGERQFDAVLTTAAIHWLLPPDMARVYRQIAGLLRPCGVLISGDLVPLPAHQTRIRASVRRVDAQRQTAASANGAESWPEWWEALRTEPSLREEFAERDRIWPPGSGTEREVPSQAFHEAALIEGGFVEAAVVWQDLEERLLLAVR